MQYVNVVLGLYGIFRRYYVVLSLLASGRFHEHKLQNRVQEHLSLVCKHKHMLKNGAPKYVNNYTSSLASLYQTLAASLDCTSGFQL